MSQQSIIEHKANMYYVEFREDYLAICLECVYKKPVKDGYKCKASPYCKALILAIMEHWTNDKRGKGQDLYVFMSYPQWIDAMYGMFGRTVVIDSIDELLGERLISREPYKMFGRDTFKYLLNTKLVNERMKALPDRDPHATHPLVIGSDDPSTNNLDPFTSKRVATTSKRVTHPLVTASQPLVNDDPSISGRNIYSYPDTTQNQNIDSPQTDKEESVPPQSQALQPQEAIASDTHASLEEKKPRARATRKKASPPVETSEDLLATASPEVQAIVQEWVSIFKDPIAITETVMKHATTLDKFKPKPGEIKECRLWMYATDQKGWYRNRGMNLGDVAREFEKFRSTKSIPEQKPALQLVSKVEATKPPKKLLSPDELKSMPMAGW
jgi:hypothetical protein